MGGSHLPTAVNRRARQGQAFLARKAAEVKTPREARRALKRHLANVLYRRLHTWANTTPAMNPLLRRIERFIRTMVDAWAYAATYGSSADRTAALPGLARILELAKTTRLPQQEVTRTRLNELNNQARTSHLKRIRGECGYRSPEGPHRTRSEAPCAIRRSRDIITRRHHARRSAKG
jgi:hypothetical protein